MFCPKCGKKNAESDKFCAFCGTALISNVENDTLINDTYSNESNNTSKVNHSSNYYNQVSGNYSEIPNGNTAYVNQTTATTTAQIKASPKVFLILAEVAAIIALLFLFVTNAKNEYSPEKVAENYFQTYTEGDLGDVYQYIDAGEGDFLNEETFKTMVNLSKDTPRGDISNYSVVVKSNDGYRADVTITYQTKSNANVDKKMKLMLTKTGNKKLLFFDEWAVSNSFTICKDFNIFVPENSQVTLDGIDVEKNAKKEKMSDGQVKYSIDKIFAGNHVVEVKADNLQDKKEVVNFTENEYYMPNMKLTEEAVKNLTDDAVLNMKKFVEAAIQKKASSEIGSIIKANDTDALQSDYENFSGYIKKDWWNSNNFTYEEVVPSTATVSDVETAFHQISIEEDDDYDYGTIVGFIEVKGNMKCSYPKSELEECDILLTQTYNYGYVDGSIKLVSVNTGYETNY